MANPTRDRATRVHQQDYELTTCPVCEGKIIGTLTVEVILGEVTVTPEIRTGEHISKPTASVAVTTNMRSLALAHDCRSATVARESATVATPVSDQEQ